MRRAAALCASLLLIALLQQPALVSATIDS